MKSVYAMLECLFCKRDFIRCFSMRFLLKAQKVVSNFSVSIRIQAGVTRKSGSSFLAEHKIMKWNIAKLCVCMYA